MADSRLLDAFAVKCISGVIPIAYEEKQFEI